MLPDISITMRTSAGMGVTGASAQTRILEQRKKIALVNKIQ
jgi:hypothetical protein